MKKNLSTRKLTLAKETLRRLGINQLRRAAGGVTFTCETESCGGTCVSCGPTCEYTCDGCQTLSTGGACASGSCDPALC